MATPLGLRTVQIFKDVPANTDTPIGLQQGNILYAEVTNTGETDIDFIVNENIQGGRAGAPIPIAAGDTRAIPMALYSFRATGVVTVVAYGM